MIKILTIGKINKKYIDLVNEYAKRITKYDKIEIIECKTEETAMKYAENCYKVVLDEFGKTCSTPVFSGLLNKINMEQKNIAFIIGPGDGLSENIKANANLKLALSELTLQHDMALLVLIEQLYRAFSIIKGEPYHK